MKIYISKYSFILSTLMALVAATACRDDMDIFIIEDDNYAGNKLVISTNEVNTRANDGHFDDDPYGETAGQKSEELISSAELYFFTSSEDTQAAFHHISITDISKITKAELSLKMPANKTDNFVKDPDDPNKATAYVYALVNMPASTILPDQDHATLEALKQLWVEAPEFTSAEIPSSFVMRGGNTVTLTGSGREAEVSGWIPVERLAAKVRLFANISERIYLDEEGKTITRKEGETEEQLRSRSKEIWESRPTTQAGSETKDNVFLYFYNYTTKGRLDGYKAYTPEVEDQRKDLLGYDKIDRSESRKDCARLIKKGVVNLEDYEGSSSLTTVVDRSKYPYTHETAYYSYPNVWDSSTLEEKLNTYVVLRVNWERVYDRDSNDNSQDSFLSENFYYQIPVNRLATETKDKDCLDPNTYYRIKINIGMLGSKDLGSPLEVDASYEVVPWSTEPVDVNLKGRRYLVVNQTEWEMNNVSRINIPFSSSHEVEILKCYVTYFRYNDVWGTDTDTKPTGSDDYDEHTSKEFINWLSAAKSKNILEKEGEITQSGLPWGETTATKEQILYYKKKYFYDEIYGRWGTKDDADTKNDYGAGYKYYIGHEHPKTFQNDLVGKPEGIEDSGWDQFEKKYQMKSIFTCKVDAERNEIIFNHPLIWWKEAYSDGKYYYTPELNKVTNKLRDEYSRCEISIILKHKDRPENEHLFEETIHITQYPGMYVEVSHDYGKPTGGNPNGNFVPQVNGNLYVLVNGNRQEAGLATNWYEVTCYMPYFGFINFNPNMYVIHTTQLSEENNGKYIIGDPRSLYYNNMLGRNDPIGDSSSLKMQNDIKNTNNTWYYWYWGGLLTGWTYDRINIKNADIRLVDSDSNGNYLKYYYPTDETEGIGTKSNFIAPSFRVASSFGKVSLSYSYASGWTGTNNLDQESRKEARRRCASYQEAGRPAGRWRIPTISEIEYVMQLSIDGKIPHLFGLPNSSNEVYWCSTDAIKVDVVNNKIESYDYTNGFQRPPAVRCVYDEWYWTKIDKELGYNLSPIEESFIWGDVIKDNPQ